MALLTAQQITQAGVVVTTVAAAAGGDTVAPAPYLELEVVNGAGAPITVTVDNKVPSNYGSDDNLAVSVTNGTTKRISLGSSPDRWVDPTTGLIGWTYSSATTITVAVTRR